MTEILRAELGLDITLIVGDFLPLEEPFGWFYPERPRRLEERRDALDRRQRLDFLYSLLKNKRYRAEIVHAHDFPTQIQFRHRPDDTLGDLLCRALRDGCVTRLDNLKPFVSNCVVQCFDIAPPGVQWLVRNRQVAVSDSALLRFVLHEREAEVRERLRPLLPAININELLDWCLRADTLKWYLQNPSLLYIPSDFVLDLDTLWQHEVRIWLEFAPFGQNMFTYTDLIDETQSVEMLDFLFKKLYNFLYTERAIANAIALNKIEVLEWWEAREAEESLKMCLPRVVQTPQCPTPAVSEWAKKRGSKIQTINSASARPPSGAEARPCGAS